MCVCVCLVILCVSCVVRIMMCVGDFLYILYIYNQYFMCLCMYYIQIDR